MRKSAQPQRKENENKLRGAEKHVVNKKMQKTAPNEKCF